MEKIIRVASFPNPKNSNSTQNPYVYQFFSALEPYKIESIKDAQFSKDYFQNHKDTVDIVHIHWLHMIARPGTIFNQFKKFILFTQLLKLIKKQNIKIVWTCHNILPHENRNIVDLLILGVMLYYCNLIICHSKSTEKKIQLLTLHQRQICTMYHGNYTGFIENSISRNDARKILDIPQSTFVYLFFGFIKRYKGIEDLIDAFLKLKDPNTQLFIVGEYNYSDSYFKSEILPKIKKDSRIHYNGGCLSSDIQIYFNAADAIVFPFKRITSSGSVLLASTFKKPIVARKNDLFQEILSSTTEIFTDQTTFVEALKNIQKLKDADIVKVLRDQELKYLWSEVVKPLIPFYRQLID